MTVEVDIDVETLKCEIKKTYALQTELLGSAGQLRQTRPISTRDANARS